MTTPLRETAFAAVVARLAAQLSGVTVERSRRSDVDVLKEDLPRAVVSAIDWQPDESVEPGVVHYTLTIAVQGFVRARTGTLADQAASALHASVVAALAGWTPATAGLGDVAELDVEFQPHDSADSKVATGEFTARFSLLCLAVLGSPYTA